MSVNSFLVNHALRHVWQAPKRDTQNLYVPARICAKEGVWNKIKVGWNTYKLPTQKERYFVYQIGNIAPDRIGLTAIKDTWVNLAAVCAAENVMVDLFSANGVQLPRFSSWYLYTSDHNLVIVVKEQKKVPVNLGVDDLYFRVYSNAFFRLNQQDTGPDLVKAVGGLVQNNAEILALQHQYDDYRVQGGAVWCWRNGYLIDSLSLVTVQPGDVVEFVYDSSVKRVVDYPLSTEITFDSTLDEVRKYLLHYSGEGESAIDFHDDVDFYLYTPGTNGRLTGVYYHRAKVSLVRQVTHRDYAIPTTQVEALANAQGWGTSQLVIRAFIREGGSQKFLVDENNRIKELYKLGEHDRLQAMLGLDSSVPNWQAAVLEHSEYAAIMRQPLMRLQQTTVEDAYGYNAIAKLVGDTPKKMVINGINREIPVGYALQQKSTVLEYDADGLLLGFYSHLQGAEYTARNYNCDMAEQLVGLASDMLEEYYAQHTVVLANGIDYRMYLCPIVDGVATNVWQDVTDDPAMYVISGNVLTWSVDPTKYHTLVRGNSIMLGYSFSASHTNGCLSFSIKHRVTRNGVTAYQTMQIPPGSLRIYMNKRRLIEGLDFIIQWPRVVLTNQEYLKDVSRYSQEFTVFGLGFCDSNLQREPMVEYGHVIHGALSRDKQYDLRDDKVQHIAIAGAVYDKSELVFAENDSMVRVLDPLNGKPYVVEDIVVPFRDMALQKTLALRTESQAIDARISNYLTLKLPETPIDVVEGIQGKHSLYSPFVARLYAACVNGYIQDERLFGNYGAELVEELCQPYLWLLDYEPTYPTWNIDTTFVEVRPHPLMTVPNLNVYYYRFINRAIARYLNDRVTLSGYVTVTAN